MKSGNISQTQIRRQRLSKLKIAEIFYSLQGEGLYTGVPSVFVRTFGCNFQCRGFGMPDGELTDEPERIAERLKHNPEWNYEELPLAKTGCDSYASWHPKFKHLSPVMEVSKVVDEMEHQRQLRHPVSLQDGQVHLVLTGGEPLLGWQRSYPDFFDAIKERGYRHVTIETNGTQEISDALKDYFFLQQVKYAEGDAALNFTFSVSPKLPCSGEDVDDALRPEIVADYQRYGRVYLKFVVEKQEDIHNITYFRDAYKEAGWDGETYLMPCGGDPDLYNVTAPEVADMCMHYGYRYSPRLQVDIWKNEWGT